MMRKILSLLLVLTTLVSILSLTSCHGNVNPMPAFEVPDEFDTSKQCEITFWAKHESNNEQRTAYAEAIRSFEEIYPNISVTIKEYTNYNDIYNDVITNISTKTTPNVCITYPDHIATYMTGENVVVPLDELMSDGKFGLGGSEVRFDSVTQAEIVPDFLEECVIRGKYYAMPFMRSTEALYINKDLVEKLGYEVPEVVTWDFIFEVSDKALEKDSSGKYKVNGQKTMIPFIYKSTDNMMIQMLAQLGAGYSTENAEIEIFNEDTKDVLYMISESAKTRAFSTFKISSYPGNYLNKGQCIFAVDSTAGATWMGAEAPHMDIDGDSVTDFETVVRAVPQFNVDSPKMISQGPSVCIFNKEDPGEVLASWLFVQYLLTDSVQIAYSQTEGYLPVTTSAQQTAEYRDYLSRAGERDENGEVVELYYDVKIAATKLLLSNIENSFVTPVFNGSVSLRNAAGQLIEDVTMDTRRDKKIDDSYMEELFSKVSSLYRLDQISSGEMYKKKITSLPTQSVLLLSAIGLTAVTLGAVVTVEKIKKRRKGKH